MPKLATRTARRSSPRTIRQAAADLSYRFADAATEAPAPAPDQPADQPEEAPAASAVTWHGVLVQEGVMTGDGRLIEPNALRWENLPLVFRWVEQDNGAHDGAMVVGRILTATRASNGDIVATGDFDMGSEAGREAARQVDQGLCQGVSVDLDDVSFEIRVAQDVINEMQAMMDGDMEDPADGPKDSDGRVTIAEIGADDEVMVTTDARIRAATLVAIPAFADARIELDQPLDQTAPAAAEPAPVEENALAASSYPTAPPPGWFADPGLDGPTGVTVTDEGRIYGHLATWGTCHTAYPGQCVTPPTSDHDYAYFRTGIVTCSDGSEVPVGRITMNTLHAGKNLNATDTLAHYEHTGNAVADVAAGEDEHGIWVAGALRPGVTDEQVRSLRSSPLSGDWRRVGAGLELVAALAVNVPGFPVPRTQGMVASGRMFSLVASGMIQPGTVTASGSPRDTARDRYVDRLMQEEARKLATRVTADHLADQVRGHVHDQVVSSTP